MKEPKIRSLKETEDADYINMVNRTDILNEKAVYERLGSHDGIIKCLKTQDESIELAFANQGDLAAHMQRTPTPSRNFRAKWIQSLVDTFSYVNSRRIINLDVALRNVLVHDNALKLCDFGQTVLLPLDADMERFCVHGTTPQIEILQLGCLLYSIAVWQELKYDYFDTERWPEAEELPAMDDILFASVIRKCWKGEYASMEALQRDIRLTDTSDLEELANQHDQK